MTTLTEEVAEKISSGDAQREERWAAETADRNSARADIEQAFKEVKQEHAERDDFSRSKEAAAELSDRYPKTKPSELVARFMEIDEGMRRDPLGTAQQLEHHYTRVSPRPPKQEAQPEWWENDPGEQGVAGAVRRAMKELRSDGERFEDTADTRAALKQRFPGLSYKQALEHVANLDAALTMDPALTSARLATASLPAHEHVQQYAQAEARVADAAGFIDRVAQSGLLPGFDGLIGQIADVLEDPAFESTGHWDVDLKNAYVLARDRAHVARSRKAAVSIRGAPGGAVAASAPSGGSVADEIRKSFAALRGNA